MIQSGRRINCISFLIICLSCLYNYTVLFALASMSSSSAEIEIGGPVSLAAPADLSSGEEFEIGGPAAPLVVDWRKRPRTRAPKPIEEKGNFWAFVVTAHTAAPKHRLVGIVNFAWVLSPPDGSAGKLGTLSYFVHNVRLIHGAPEFPHDFDPQHVTAVIDTRRLCDDCQLDETDTVKSFCTKSGVRCREVVIISNEQASALQTGECVGSFWPTVDIVKGKALVGAIPGHPTPSVLNKWRRAHGPQVPSASASAPPPRPPEEI
jgi:hypothetical protein